MAVVLALAGFVAGHQFRQQDEATAIPHRILSLPVDGRPIRARISPDGGHVAYVTRTSDGFTLWAQDLGQSEPVRVAGPNENVGAVAWSPDGARLAFLDGPALRTAAANGSQVTEVCRLPGTPSYGVTWDPSGASIVFSARPANSGRGSMFEVPARGGEPQPLRAPAGARGMGRTRAPSFLPLSDRRILLFASGAQREPRITAWNIDTGDTTDVAAGNWPVYSPSGHIVYEAGRTLWALPFSLEKLEATGEAFPVGEGTGIASISGDGTLVFVESSHTGPEQLVWKSRTGERLETIGQPQERIRAPILSPDTKRVAVSGFESGNPDIWVHDVQRGIKTRVTSHPAGDDRPLWSPDGKQLVFASNRDGRSEIFMQAADGTGEAEKVMSAPGRGQAFAMDWSRDGKYVMAMSVSRGAPAMLYFTPGGGADPVPFLEREFFDRTPSFSPDSRWVAYESNESGGFEVYIQRFPERGAKTRVSVNGGERPRWRRDGRELYFLEGETLMAAPITLGAEPVIGTAERLFEQPGISPQAGPHYDISPDGQRFVVVEPVGGEPERTIRVVQNWVAGLDGPGQ
ncbi:MAG: hypothetical protein GY953_43420 [bacterium]|nr:hypothetical protein [bacterium]